MLLMTEEYLTRQTEAEYLNQAWGRFDMQFSPEGQILIKAMRAAYLRRF